jgi:hypothetical protein
MKVGCQEIFCFAGRGLLGKGSGFLTVVSNEKKTPYVFYTLFVRVRRK